MKNRGRYCLFALAVVALIPAGQPCIKGRQESSSLQRRGKAIRNYDGGGGGHNNDLTSADRGVRVTQLNRRGQTNAITPGLRLRKGDQIYGRIYVPYSSGPWTLTVVASWAESGASFYSSPLWMFIKMGRGIPSTADYDKTSISFVSRRYSRLRLEEVSGGSRFHLMLQALEDLPGLSISVRLTPASRITNLP